MPSESFLKLLASNSSVPVASSIKSDAVVISPSVNAVGKTSEALVSDFTANLKEKDCKRHRDGGLLVIIIIGSESRILTRSWFSMKAIKVPREESVRRVLLSMHSIILSNEATPVASSSALVPCAGVSGPHALLKCKEYMEKAMYELDKFLKFRVGKRAKSLKR
ncbi:uncharacterized protein LOC141693749 [Apium graveolens]|uniref:uncharacterized protein LOC141693749 n=1 Tax=Apium graveolens TaxID=4045 RepID=UPI003D7BFF15